MFGFRCQPSSCPLGITNRNYRAARNTQHNQPRPTADKHADVTHTQQPTLHPVTGTHNTGAARALSPSLSHVHVPVRSCQGWAGKVVSLPLLIELIVPSTRYGSACSCLESCWICDHSNKGAGGPESHQPKGGFVGSFHGFSNCLDLNGLIHHV